MMSEELFSVDHIHTSWQKVNSKGKSGGIDGQTLDDYKQNLKENLNHLRNSLNTGMYSPEPSLMVEIPKDNPAEKRRLGLLTVTDKIAQHSVKKIIEPLFEKKFNPFSYAYRPSHGHYKIINAITGQLKQGYHYTVALDIDNFFDSINPEILSQYISELKLVPQITTLLQLWIKIGVIRDGIYLDSNLGIPQGGVLSPLLSNLYLTRFDNKMSNLGKEFRYLRYADNFLIMSKKENSIPFIISDIEQFLEKNLQLKLNPFESKPKAMNDGFDFCGIFFSGDQTGVTRTISEKKMQKNIRQIDSLFNSAKKTSLSHLCTKTDHFLDAWKRYYSPYETEKQLLTLEEHVIQSFVEFFKKKLPTGNIPKNEFVSLVKGIHWIFPKNEEILDRLLKPEIKRKTIKEDSSDKQQKSPRIDVRRKVYLKKRKYQRLYLKRFDLSISTSGMQLGKSGNFFVLKNQGKTESEIPIATLKHIGVMARKSSISTDVLFACAENNISFELIGFDGKPRAILSVPNNPAWKVSDSQIQSLTNDKAVTIAKQLMISKIHNQMALLKYFGKYKAKNDPHFAKKLVTELQRMENYCEKIKMEQAAESQKTLSEKLMGYEGMAASSYWAVVKLILPKEAGFDKRTRKGARDIFNCCLNYGYGILYSRVWTEVMRAELNPSISFVHLEQRGKPTLVYDVIEPFRQPIVDRTIISLFTKRQIDFYSATGGELSEDTRRLIVSNLLERLNLPFIHRRTETTLENEIAIDCKQMADFLTSKQTKYKPFLMKW